MNICSFYGGYSQSYFLANKQQKLHEVSGSIQELVWYVTANKMADCHFYTSLFVQIEPTTYHVLIRPNPNITLGPTPLFCRGTVSQCKVAPNKWRFLNSN